MNSTAQCAMQPHQQQQSQHHQQHPLQTPPSLSMLTYNVWFREDVALVQRMQGLADVIIAHGYPNILLLQEVTHNIMMLWQQAAWYHRYQLSSAPAGHQYFTVLAVKREHGVRLLSAFEDQPFQTSMMGRGLRSVVLEIAGRQLMVATSHLESVVPPSTNSVQRQQQLRTSVTAMEGRRHANLVLAGDMNWQEKLDGEMPLPAGWSDAWPTLHGSRPGNTYDPGSNAMLGGKPGSRNRGRFDRFLSRLTDWQPTSVELVGTQALPGVTYVNSQRNITLPVTRRCMTVMTVP
ncbi:MAG: hypothetical protein WDW38_001316 [Sanguina aurantia]